MRVGSTVTTLNPKHEKFMDIGVVNFVTETKVTVRYSDGKYFILPKDNVDVVNIGFEVEDVTEFFKNQVKNKNSSIELLQDMEETFEIAKFEATPYVLIGFILFCLMMLKLF